MNKAPQSNIPPSVEAIKLLSTDPNPTATRYQHKTTRASGTIPTYEINHSPTPTSCAYQTSINKIITTKSVTTRSKNILL